MIFLIFSTINIICDTEDSLIFSYSPEYSIIKEGDSVRIELNEGVIFTSVGEPELPFVVKNILVSEGGATLRYYVNKKEYVKERIVSNKNILFDSEKVDYKPIIFEPVKIDIYGDKVKTADIKIYPFSYDGEKIEIRKDIIIKVYFKGKWYKPNYRIFVEYLNNPKGEANFKRTKLSKDDGLWIKMKIVKNGIYKIDRKFLNNNGINPDLIAPENIEIRTGYKNVFKFTKSFYDSLDTLPSKIPAIYNLNNENGKFDDGEYILFYASSLVGFKRNYFATFNDPTPIPGTDKNWWYYYNPYTDTNVYWIKTNGTKMEIEEKIMNDGIVTENFYNTIHFEKDLENPSRSGLTWIWSSIVVPSNVNYFNFSFRINDAIDTFCIIRMGLYCGISTTMHYSKLTFNNQAVYDTFFTPRYFYRERSILIDTFYTLVNGENNLRFEILNSNAIIFIDYIEITYRKNVNSVYNDIISFPDSSERLFNLNRRYVLGTDDYLKPVKLIKTGDYYGYDGKEFFVTDTVYYPVEAKVSDVKNLWNLGADWICITSSIFKDEALILSEYREKHLNGFQNPIAKVITIDEIYDNFSYGVRDPGAIKRFLLHTAQSWLPAPSFVLLFGKGTYDYKNLKSLTSPQNFVPIHTFGPNIDLSSLLATNQTVDVWFVDFDWNTRPDIPIGRVTVTSKLEAKQWVDKIIDFESSSGEWRNRVIILADDEKGSSSNEWMHTDYSEDLYENLPKWIEAEKIYMVLYPLEYGMKPSATNQFIEEFNRGAIFGYYMGHGNIYQLAHEKVLQMEDIERLKNWRKCPMFYFATCNAGFFERPDERSIADHMNLYSDGGSIVSIASTRATYAGANRSFGINIINNLFFKKTMGEVYTAAINLYGDTCYTFFGDPATSLFMDTFNIQVNVQDTLTGGSHYNMSIGNKFPLLYLSIHESDTTINYTLPDGYLLVFIMEGKKSFFSNYKNDDSIGFIIPFDTKQSDGRLRLHIYNNNKEFHFYQKIYLKKGVPSESIPPEIKIFSGNKELNDYDYVKNGSELKIVLNDESGIDMRRKENIVLFINNYSKPIYLGDKLSYYSGTYKSGEIPFFLNITDVDTFFLDIYCVDNCGNLGKRKINLLLSNKDMVWGVYNFPNPASLKTFFTFYLLNDHEVELSVYTVSGKKVWSKKQICYSGFNKIEWELIDDFGRELSNGVYYYSLQIGKEKIFKKMAILR